MVKKSQQWREVFGCFCFLFSTLSSGFEHLKLSTPQLWPRIFFQLSLVSLTPLCFHCLPLSLPLTGSGFPFEANLCPLSRANIDVSASNDKTISAHILSRVLHFGVDVKQHHHKRAPLRVKSVLHFFAPPSQPFVSVPRRTNITQMFKTSHQLA